MFDAVFSFLFKYPLLVFEQGDFAFGATRNMWLTAAIVAAAGAYAVWTYRQVAALAGRDRAVLIGTRVLLFGVVLFGLLRPMLLLKVAVLSPQRGWVVCRGRRHRPVHDRGGRG